MTKTALDKKIARLEAELKNAKASKSKEARKERNNQLMAFGIMLEKKYRSLDKNEQTKIKEWAESLDERNKSRVLAGLARLSKVFSLILIFFVLIGTGDIAFAEEPSFITQVNKSIELDHNYVKYLEFFKDEQNPESLEKGFKLIMSLAEQGHSKSQFWIGRCYSNGWGTAKDPVKGFRWTNKAAKQNDLSGLYFAGLSYLVGDGVIQNIATGCEYLKIAAESDDPDGEGIDSIRFRAVTAYNRYCNIE